MKGNNELLLNEATLIEAMQEYLYKRITKKEVSECLRSFTGWKFSYSFKEDQRLILSEYANIDAMTEVLNELGIRVAGFKMPVSPITGYMALVKAC